MKPFEIGFQEPCQKKKKLGLTFNGHHCAQFTVEQLEPALQVVLFLPATDEDVS